MVFVYRHYRQDNDRHSPEPSDPMNVSSITICADKSKYLSWNSDDSSAECECGYEDLARMIQRSPVKIPNTDLYGIDIQESDPAYLELLLAILNKSDSLRFDSLGGDAAYRCFMGSMFQQNGLRELVVCSTTVIMSTYQSKLLFEGIAVSQSLEKLDLTANFSEPTQAGAVLANALKRNNSLRTLGLCVNVQNGGTELGDLFQDAITDKQILECSIGRMQGWQTLPFNVLANVLCTNKCTVKKLEFASTEPTPRTRCHLEDWRNASVTHFTVLDTSLCCLRLMETAALFRSIKELHLAQNRISDLSPLDPLVLGDNVTLETLNLACNVITEKDAVAFFRKVPNMTRLRYVSFVCNPFTESSGSWKNVLAEVAWQNRSLECICCADDPTDIPELNFSLSLNRGGRRASEIEAPTSLPRNLWPNVLERAGKISYFSPCDDIEESPSLDSTRPDVAYWLLKEKMLGSCLYC